MTESPIYQNTISHPSIPMEWEGRSYSSRRKFIEWLASEYNCTYAHVQNVLYNKHNWDIASVIADLREERKAKVLILPGTAFEIDGAHPNKVESAAADLLSFAESFVSVVNSQGAKIKELEKAIEEMKSEKDGLLTQLKKKDDDIDKFMKATEVVRDLKKGIDDVRKITTETKLDTLHIKRQNALLMEHAPEPVSSRFPQGRS